MCGNPQVCILTIIPETLAFQTIVSATGYFFFVSEKSIIIIILIVNIFFTVYFSVYKY